MINHHLHTFIQVADSGSFLKASEKMYVSANAITKQINLLEQHLELKLFKRSKQGLTLTDAGELIYDETKKMIRHSNSVLKKAHELENSSDTVIRVGVSLMNPASILMDIWEKAAGGHQNIHLEVVPYEDSVPVFTEILNNLGNNIDVIACLYENSYWGDKYRSFLLCNLPVCIACSKYHPLASKKLLTINDLKGQNVIIRKRGLSQNIDQIHNEFDSHPDIHRLETATLDYNTFNKLASSKDLILSYECWNSVHPLLTTIPVDWDYKSPYGLIYSKDPSDELLKFILAIGNAAS